MTTLGRVKALAEAVAPELIRLRHDLHAHPEVGLDLPVTVGLVDAALAARGMVAERGRAVTSRVLVIDGPTSGPTVVLRADMDALALEEDAGHFPRSQHPGRMHACGHDLHTAMLVGAAIILNSLRDQIAGRVVLVWQPGEEGHEGMQAMLDEGLLDIVGPAPAASYAIHVLSDLLPNGVFVGRGGVSHATTGTFRVAVTGKGGHGAFPHSARDPIAAAAEIVTALHVAVTRSIDVFDPAVLTVASLHAGSAPNVIPDTAVLSGTFRAFSTETATALHALIRRVVAGVADGHGLTAEVLIEDGYPVVSNDGREVAVFRTVIEEMFGSERFRSLDAPIPAGDDMGRLMQHVPGAFFLLGARDPASSAPAPNHSPTAAFDDHVIGDGAAALAGVALYRTQKKELTI